MLARAAASTLTRSHAMDEAHARLEHVFGYKSFRSHQEKIIATVLDGGDCLALMPTGGGKSQIGRAHV